MSELLWLTLGGGIACAVLCRIIGGRWFSPAVLYWGHWALALLTAWYCASEGWLPEISDYGLSLIEATHIGAFPGFLIGSMIGAALIVPAGGGRTQAELLALPRLQVWVRRLTWLLVGVAILHLVYRVSRVGLSSSFYYESRMDFIEGGKGLSRLTFYVMPLLTVVATYAGACSRLRVPTGKLLWILFAAIFINSLANGSRAGMFAVALYYLFGYFMVSAPADPKRSGLREFLVRYRRQAAVLVVLVAVFQALGSWRVNPEAEELTQGSQSWIPAQFIAYIALPSAALGPLAELLPVEPTDGQMLFPFAAKWAHRFGLLKDLEVSHEVYDRETLRQIDWRVSFTQATAVIAMVSDFGEDGVPWISGLLMAFCQALFLVARRHGVIGLTAASLVMMSAFEVAQDPFFVNGAIFLALLWSAALAFLGRDARRRSAPAAYGLPAQRLT